MRCMMTAKKEGVPPHPRLSFASESHLKIDHVSIEIVRPGGARQVFALFGAPICSNEREQWHSREPVLPISEW